jgi:hypothetical protein
VLLMAIVPNVFYVGHWSLPGLQHDHSIASLEDLHEHAAHCHVGPSECTGPHAMAGAWWVGDAPLELAIGAQPRIIEQSSDNPVPDVPASRIPHPPRYA